MRPRQNDLRTAGFFLHILNVGAEPVAPAIGLLGNLLVRRKNGFGLSQIDDDVAMLDPLNDPVDDIAFSVHETGINRISFSILHFLNNDLLGGLGCNAAEICRIHFHAQAVADFTLRVQLPPFFQADLSVWMDGKSQRLTQVNEDLFSYKNLGKVEELWWQSSFDNQKIQGWIVTPPDFDPGKKYPLILEIHGGPFAMYGPAFAAEIQLFAAAGYVVLYTNPRGSTGYGQAFGNSIHHDYPNHDYEDLMSGVDAVISKGYIDTKNLFVTGGSGGGVLTAWIIGKTDRFKAAVVAKPVINWYSHTLYADNPAFFTKYWFSGKPWEVPEEYMKRSPISLVGNVKTPTMILTGEQDFRTPMAESEQYYAALKLQQVEAALVDLEPALRVEILGRQERVVGPLHDGLDHRVALLGVLRAFHAHGPGPAALVQIPELHPATGQRHAARRRHVAHAHAVVRRLADRDRAAGRSADVRAGPGAGPDRGTFADDSP